MIADLNIPKTKAGRTCSKRSSRQAVARQRKIDAWSRTVVYDRHVAVAVGGRLRCEDDIKRLRFPGRQAQRQTQPGKAVTRSRDGCLGNGDTGTARVGDRRREALFASN